MSSLIALSLDDVDRLLPELSRPHIHRCTTSIVDGRLWLDLVVETGISLLGRLPVTLSVTARLESPDLIAMDVRMERAMGVAAFVRPFLKSIMEHMMPADVKGIVKVESNARVIVHVDKLEFASQRLQDRIELHDVLVPEGKHAAAFSFSIKIPSPQKSSGNAIAGTAPTNH